VELGNGSPADQAAATSLVPGADTLCEGGTVVTATTTGASKGLSKRGQASTADFQVLAKPG